MTVDCWHKYLIFTLVNLLGSLKINLVKTSFHCDVAFGLKKWQFTILSDCMSFHSLSVLNLCFLLVIKIKRQEIASILRFSVCATTVYIERKTSIFWTFLNTSSKEYLTISGYFVWHGVAFCFYFCEELSLLWNKLVRHILASTQLLQILKSGALVTLELLLTQLPSL